MVISLPADLSNSGRATCLALLTDSRAPVLCFTASSNPTQPGDGTQPLVTLDFFLCHLLASFRRHARCRLNGARGQLESSRHSEAGEADKALIEGGREEEGRGGGRKKNLKVVVLPEQKLEPFGPRPHLCARGGSSPAPVIMLVKQMNGCKHQKDVTLSTNFPLKFY